MFFPYYDPYYYLIIIGILLSLAASARVKSTFAKYSRVRSMSGMTGAQVAERILRNAGIYDVQIERVSGNLSDHYDPRTKVLRLSDSVYGQSSVAAIGVAAHECGHAIQHQNSYIPLTLRSALVPVANFGSSLSLPLIIIGFSMGYVEFLIDLGILLFGAAVLFQIITLPVEFNASRRAVIKLGETGILMNDELRLSKKVLNAAALTYVAAAAASILQLLRLILLFRGGRNRD
ncbi:zinc metallopeptidase [Lachnospiraceae bacterium MD1]|uniref:Zinc metallopeptidase n=1 Tax=Variimorphobacter saccharofermentans TaxID=2755051 RepID=A0A839JZA6_9FIRM|nr:zinc metallopeptidase [Variimorphobacter saccharofermentans]MBB2182694.1 zinc metallopeptidase [Variimorphobacter saccharofermentans]